MVDENHYVTREEYQRLLALAQPKKGGFWAAVVNFATWLLLCVGAAGGIAFVLFLKTDIFMAESAAPPAATAPARLPPTTPYSGGGGGGAQGGIGTLPDCSTVTDSRTACQGAVGEMPQGAVVEEPPQAEQATGTPEPAYVTETCLTPPGARPCWLEEGAAWEPPASVPETPIVLVPPPPLVFADSACAAWHAPLPWPEGCPIGGDE